MSWWFYLAIGSSIFLTLVLPILEKKKKK